MKKLTLKERGRKGGKSTWSKIPKKERTRIMRQRANQLWAKIRTGQLSIRSLA